MEGDIRDSMKHMHYLLDNKGVVFDIPTEYVDIIHKSITEDVTAIYQFTLTQPSKLPSIKERNNRYNSRERSYGRRDYK